MIAFAALGAVMYNLKLVMLSAFLLGAAFYHANQSAAVEEAIGIFRSMVRKDEAEAKANKLRRKTSKKEKPL